PILDACGRTVLAVPGTHDPAPLCNGDVVWNFTYTACDGTTMVPWTYTYHVIYSGGLMAPAPGESTVSCPSQSQVPPMAPPIMDACGRQVLAVPGTHDPAPLCNGDVVWNFTYTACDGTTTVPWSYTYHVIYSGGLVPPPPGESTVSCPAQAQVSPMVPPIMDACGRTVLGVLFGVEAAPLCNGDVIWTFSYTACDGVTSVLWSYTYHVVYSGGLTPPAPGQATVSCPAQSQVPPVAPPILDACGRTVLAVPGTHDPAPECNGDVIWNFTYTACDGTTTAPWTYTYHVIYSGGLTPPLNGSSTVNCPAQAIDPGPPAAIMDACGRMVNPVLVGSSTPPACEGTVVWTYRYTACDMTTTVDWTYTYTIDYTGALTPPMNGSSTVSCPAQAVNPGAPAPIIDACGRTVNAVLVGSSTPPSCEGTVVWTYRYTACDMTTTADWTYTYTIDYSGALTPPSNGNAIVMCASQAVDPGPPAPIMDACGRTVNAVLVGSSAPPSCEGMVTWTYRYTACDNTTTADWTYTYTIDHTVAPHEIGGPVSTSSTISCYLSATPPAVLPTFRDVCNNPVTMTGPVIGGTNTGDCGGTITYTYTFTDCSGLSTPWVYTYNISCNSLVLYVYLEGPYNATLNQMDNLVNYYHLLPGQDKALSPNPIIQVLGTNTTCGQPYTVAPYNYSGNLGQQFGDPTGVCSMAPSIPYPPDVVDWVLVTIRKNGRLPAHNIWTCAGWVHQDGHVSFPESCPLPAFNLTDNYYILIQHRNHLGVLSLNEADMPCGTAQLSVDFRISDSYIDIPGFRVGQKQVEPGVWAMYDANGEQVQSIPAINSFDHTLWKTLQGVIRYNLGDFNMDAVTNSADETIWKINQNKTSGVVFY
ncbi:MAG TPA: hypothetical protein VJ508_08775, partial [Saprospiraceae bacterium]|nr:hypothetical protein [Saprospiraceae bacterium]